MSMSIYGNMEASFKRYDVIVIKSNGMKRYFLRGGARGVLEGAIAPVGACWPPSEVEHRFFRIFLTFIVPENHVSAPSSEESAPLSENSWRHPCIFSSNLDE